MSRTLMRKGMRQPQLRNCSVGSSETRLNTPVDISSPSGTPVCGKLPKNPRFCAGAYSATSTVLRENMVFTLKATITVPDVGGLRTERIVRLTASGVDVLDDFPMELHW